jgi:AbiJ N-terminal domain 5/Abortive infection C-terminus
VEYDEIVEASLRFDQKLRGRLMLALQKAVVENFDKTDWIELGYLTGKSDVIEGHGRLLRSLHWGDDDYGACVFDVLRSFADRDIAALEAVINHKNIRPYLEAHAFDLLGQLGLAEGHVPPVKVSLPSAAEVVQRALSDADSLLHSSGPTSALDRLHTALHGYLRAVCADGQVDLPQDASITAAFKALRTGHPALKDLGYQDGELGRIIGAFSTVVDAVNTIRNRASVAHPNEVLLGEDEAHLVVNAVRTLFHYLNKKCLL